MLKDAEFHWNEDSDEQKIADAKAALDSLNQRLGVLQSEEEDDNQEQQEIKWPSISDRF